ncbi:unnamed protein product [marine sediment metagenome]|uniref:Phage recombination protein Bet n=1 Tax=marine sediment metagenome TaxID=412755 RepID=X1RHC6_9ZZZZ
MEQNQVKALVAKQDADKLSTYLQPKFPKDLVNRQAALDFAKWCIAHQLEPIRDCIPFHGNPFITIEWVDRQASNDDKFKGYSYKVFSQQDKEALDFDPKDIVIECQASFEGLDTPLVGLGVVTKIEREATSGETDEVTARGYRSPVVHLHPQKMAFKRARAEALKQRFHIPAPILEELPYTTVVEAEYTVKEASKGGGKIGEQAAHKRPEEGKAGTTILSPTKAAKSPKIGAPAAKPKRDPQTIKTFDQLWQALEEDFNMMKGQAFAELNVTCQEELTELPADCYIRIASVRQ